MSTLVYTIVLLVLTLFISQIISFEVTRRRMSDNPNWLLALDKPFKYNRFVYIILLCVIWYMLVSTQTLFTMYWLLELAGFICAGVIADMVVQYIVVIYAKKRCANLIKEAHELLDEINAVDISVESNNYSEPELKFNENEVMNYYVKENTHTAFMGVDHGLWLKSHLFNIEALFYVEPYGDDYDASVNLEGTNVTVSKLTQENQLPFKESRLDVLINRYANYNKNEISRVLKDQGIAIIIQHGTQNLVEMMRMYIPFGIKGSWDADNCARTLQESGFKIIDSVDSLGKIYFTDLQSLVTYIKKVSIDLADVKKYQSFYLKALSDIKHNGSFEVSTQSFLVIAQKAG